MQSSDLFCKLTGDLPEATDKGWQGRTALLWRLIKEWITALHRYSWWDAAIWEKSRLAIIRKNNSSWSQHCQSRNYPLTQWHWLRALTTFVKFGAVTQGSVISHGGICLCYGTLPTDQGPNYTRQYTDRKQIKSPNVHKSQGRISVITCSSYTHPMLHSICPIPSWLSTSFLTGSYTEATVKMSCCMQC